MGGGTPEQERRDHSTQPGADHHRLAAGPGPAGQVLIDEGSKVLVETPSYLGALQAFSLFQPAYSSMQTDEEGIVTDALTSGQLAGARFMYCLPNFQNPTGRRMPLERRKALLEKAIAAGVPVVEDDPYGELSYSGETCPACCRWHRNMSSTWARSPRCWSQACAWASW